MYIVGVVPAVATFGSPFDFPLHLRREGVFF